MRVAAGPYRRTPESDQGHQALVRVLDPNPHHAQIWSLAP
jgi:hypothetical protein